MIRLQWRTVRFLFLAWLLIFCVWLTWRLPSLGFFRMASGNAPLPQTGMVLVSYLDGKAIDAESLAMIATGWTVFWELWPLVVLSMLLGYPFGVLIPWLCRFVVLAEKVPKQEISPQEKELRELAANLSAEVWTKTLKLQEMHKKAQQAKGEIFSMKVATGDQRKNHAALEQKAESLERELFKARAKIRRLESKRPGKPVDDDQWPE